MNLRGYIILLLLIGACSTDSESDPDPAGVTAEASSPAQVYTGDAVEFSASCSSSDGIKSATLEFSSPDVDQNFNRTEQVTGNNFSETFSDTFTSEGEASLQISCTSAQGIANSAQTSTIIEQFITGLSVELRNAANGELQEGYILAGGDSLYTENGIIEVDITDPSVNSIHSGLILDGRAGSYLRKTNISPGTDNSSELFHIDFLLRDVNTGAIIGELSRDGYDYNGPMDITRLLMHLDDNILRDGIVPRWKDYVPDKIVFADSVHFETSGNSHAFQDSDEADLLFDTYKQQWEEIIQPHLVESVPFERVDSFVFSGQTSVDEMVVIGPDSGLKDRGWLGGISLFRDDAGRNKGSYISVRDVLPDKETNMVNYEAILYRTWLHEIYSALINPGRSSENTRTDESILTRYSTLRNEISNVDSKVLHELSQNPRIGFDELASDYLILSNGY